MKLCRFILILLPLLLPGTKLLGQQPDRQEILRQVLEVYLENSEDEFDYTEWQSELEYRLDRPLNLNRARAEDLLALRFLDELEVQAILSHRKNFTDFLSVFELQAVEGLPFEKARLLSYFVKVTGETEVRPLRPRDLYQTGRHELFLRYRRILEQERAYNPANRKYPGSPDYVYTRYNYRLGSRISYGFTAEKDAGEEFFGPTQPHGFDFYSAHFYVQNVGPVKELVIGDYQLQFGQGLVLWSGLAFSKSADAINIARNGRNILPYRSANENQFLRGAAATIAAGNYSFTAFGSRKHMDGNIIGPDTADSEATAVFSGLSYSGFHRTLNELADKNAVGETLAGGRVAYNGSSLKSGVTGMFSRFSVPLRPNQRLYNKFSFSGDEYWNFGADFKYYFRNLYLFGEAAYGSQNAMAGVVGALASLHPRLDVSLLYRHYPKEYFSLYANPFKEGTSPANENGLYIGINSQINKNWRLNAYVDQFSSPWMRYLVDAPSKGYEYLVDLHYSQRKRFEMYWRFREQKKQRNASESAIVKPLEDHTRRSFRYHISVNVSKAITLKSRLELSGYQIADKEPENGTLLYQELRWNPNSRFTFTGRYTLFNVGGFNSRIYVYESDVLYAFSIPFFQDEGVRWYALGKYRLNRRTELWLRVAQTTLTNRQTFGSGDGLIEKPHRTEVKAQVRLRL